MADYYKILGLEKGASSTEIRTAYKRLAMQYHPDHNPGDAEAEEMFKQINEAYHTLSDPLRKSRYDDRITPHSIETDAYLREVYKRRYTQWQRAQQTHYKLDKEYFKIQGLAFLVFIVMSGFCFAIVHTANYFVQQKNQERWNANSQSLKHINSLFISGKFDDAFNLIKSLKQQDPFEFRFLFAHDSLVNELRHMADERFAQKDFTVAVRYYMSLKNYEDPTRFETIRKISICQYYLGNFKESLQALKHLHNQQPDDLELIYLIGMINLERLENAEEALQYFTLGRKLFNENLSEVYGAAFKVIMDPADAPDIYFDIFQGRARANLALKNYKEAIRDCNWAVFLRPHEARPYSFRAMANAGINDFTTLCTDLMQAKKLGDNQADDLMREYCR